jgi:hypothetical protein
LKIGRDVARVGDAKLRETQHGPRKQGGRVTGSRRCVRSRFRGFLARQDRLRRPERTRHRGGPAKGYLPPRANRLQLREDSFRIHMDAKLTAMRWLISQIRSTRRRPRASSSTHTPPMAAKRQWSHSQAAISPRFSLPRANSVVRPPHSEKISGGCRVYRSLTRSVVLLDRQSAIEKTVLNIESITDISSLVQARKAIRAVLCRASARPPMDEGHV